LGGGRLAGEVADAVPPSLTLYSRPGCHLCDEARAQLESFLSDRPEAELRDVNIEDDERLHAEYLERIPVVAVDGEVVSELVLDLDAVRARMDTLPR
jgi:glutaredoxin